MRYELAPRYTFDIGTMCMFANILRVKHPLLIGLCYDLPEWINCVAAKLEFELVLVVTLPIDVVRPLTILCTRWEYFQCSLDA